MFEIFRNLNKSKDQHHQSNLARLLATENINVQYSGNKQSSAFDPVTRTLSLPVFRNLVKTEVIDTLTGHEIAHALYTPHNYWNLETVNELHKETGISTNLANSIIEILEDVRVNKKILKKYPGLKRDFFVGYRARYELGHFGIDENTDLTKLSYLDRINLKNKIGVHLDIPMTDQELDLYNRIVKTDEFEDLYGLALEVIKLLSENQENQTNSGSESESESESDENDNSNPKSSEGDSDSDGTGEKENGEQSDGSGDSEGDSSESDSKTGQTDSRNSSAGGDQPQNKTEMPLPFTYETEKKTESSFYDHEKSYISNYTIDENWNWNNSSHKFKNVEIIDYRTLIKDRGVVNIDLYKIFKDKEKPLIDYMIKEFELKKAANEYHKTMVNKTGKLDMKKLQLYRVREDIFRKNETKPTGKNHGFIIFLDASGSMSTIMPQAKSQLLSLSLFYKKLNVPFDVYSFHSGTGGNYCHLCHLLSSSMKHNEFVQASAGLLSKSSNKYEYLRSTPLNITIVSAENIIREFNDKHKVDITNVVFITDGEASDSYISLKDDFHVFDSVTKISYNDKGNFKLSIAKKQTKILLQMLKTRTNCNLIGFFLTDPNFFPNVSGSFGQNYTGKDKAFADKYGFFSVKNYGYDEYYIMNKNLLGLYNHSDDNNLGKERNLEDLYKQFRKKSLLMKNTRIFANHLIENMVANLT